MLENDICKTFQFFALRDYLRENGTITKKKLQEYFPTFYTKSQMEKVLFSLLEEWKEKNAGS